jgi:hypothetical protein
MKVFIRNSSGNFVMEITVNDTDRIGVEMGGVRCIAVKEDEIYRFVAGLAPNYSDPQCAYANILDLTALTLAELLSQTPTNTTFIMFDGLTVGAGTTDDIKKERLNWLGE